MGRLIKTVLLTGATGYLGSRLLRRLMLENYSVCVVKRSQSNLESLQELTGNIKFYNNDQEGYDSLFGENTIDLIIHTATAYGRKGETSVEIKATNLDFPFLLLNEAIKHKVAYFINTGTSLPFLTNQYSLFKNQFAECLQFFGSSIVSINILLEHFFGPGDDESKFITGMINKMKLDIPEINLTAGTQIRDFIFIEDVLDAYFMIINNLHTFNGFVDLPLGSGEGITIREIVESIKELSNSKSVLKFGAVEMRSNELMKSDADITQLKKLGWFPKYNLEEGLRLTLTN